MPALVVTPHQLHVIQNALEFYIRVGIGQMQAIINHPTYSHTLREGLRPKRELSIGDQTESGKVISIFEDSILTEGDWGEGIEKRWYKREEVKLSVDYQNLDSFEQEALQHLMKGRNILLQRNLEDSTSYGLYHDTVDETCRTAYDVLKVVQQEVETGGPEL